jgi:hypothetical protein
MEAMNIIQPENDIEILKNSFQKNPKINPSVFGLVLKTRIVPTLKEAGLRQE